MTTKPTWRDAAGCAPAVPGSITPEEAVRRVRGHAANGLEPMYATDAARAATAAQELEHRQAAAFRIIESRKARIRPPTSRLPEWFCTDTRDGYCADGGFGLSLLEAIEAFAAEHPETKP